MRYRGDVVARGKASSDRPVPGLLPGRPRGHGGRIKVTGQFPSIRNATTTLRVG